MFFAISLKEGDSGVHGGGCWTWKADLVAINGVTGVREGKEGNFFHSLILQNGNWRVERIKMEAMYEF